MRDIQRAKWKIAIKIILCIYVGMLILSALYGIVGSYQYFTHSSMAVLEFDIEGNYTHPIIENAVFELEHVRTAKIPSGEMDMPLPGVGIIVYSNMTHASYSSTNRYTGPGHYRFNIGFEKEVPQYNDTLAIAVHFFDQSGRFDRAQIFTKWRWNESEY